MPHDRLGRARAPGQNRGLRPLHPRLPLRWVSRALRLAMPEADWARLDALARRHRADGDTQARAYGRALGVLMNAQAPAPTPAPSLDWLDWERHKSQRLLHRTH
jgi:hypothetical protein